MRNKLKQILLSAWTNCVSWIRSPRIWYVILIEAVLCFGTLYEKQIALNNLKWMINPFESFLFITSSQKLLTGTLFLIFISEIPPRINFHCYQLIRTSRSRWVYGCVLYCCCIVLFMILSLSFISVVTSLSNVQWTFSWTDEARIAEGIPDDMTFVSEYIRSRYSPIGAYFAFILLTGNYWLMLALIVLVFSFIHKSQYGLSIVMILQLLPWIINTFITYETPRWFPIYFADINLLSYQTDGVETFWYCSGAFVLINLILTVFLRLLVRKAPVLSEFMNK